MAFSDDGEVISGWGFESAASSACDGGGHVGREAFLPKIWPGTRCDCRSTPFSPFSENLGFLKEEDNSTAIHTRLLLSSLNREYRKKEEKET